MHREHPIVPNREPQVVVVTDLETKPSVEDAPDDASRKRKRRTTLRRILIVAVISFVLLGLASAWLLQPVPYIALGPGPASPASDIVAVPNSERVPHKGRIFFTTVSESRGRIRRFQYYWVKWVDNDYELIRDDAVTGVVSRGCEAPDTHETEAMTISQRSAMAIALRRLDKPVSVSGLGAQIDQIVAGSPADGRFSICDTILAINGKKVESTTQAVKLVKSHKPGDVLSVKIHSAVGKEDRTIEVPTRRGEDGKAQVGIVMQPVSFKVESPLKITFHPTDIGGPSAGLALTLAIIDDLTPGNLTGGRDIAVTGTIGAGGTVGEIGGIREKTIAVSRTNMKYFLVPEGNYKEAKKAASNGLHVIPVGTLDDALKELEKIGGGADLPKSTL